MGSGEGRVGESGGVRGPRRLLEMDRMVASVAVTITSLFGAGSILVGLHLTGAAVDLAAPSLAAPATAVVGLPVASCDGCSNSSPAIQTVAERAPHAVGSMPRATDPALASSHLSVAPVSAVSPPVPTARVSQPPTPAPGNAPKPTGTGTGAPSSAGQGSGHVQNATVVNLAPVAAVTAGPSGVQVNVLGDSTEGVAKVDLGCGAAASPGIGISLISGTTTCATPSTPPAPSAAGTTDATPTPEPSPAPGGLLSGLLSIVAAPGGGFTVALLPGLDQSLLSATVCTAVPGVVVTVGNMAAGCTSAAATIAAAHPGR